MRRTCFVISPIGKEGSPIRTEADSFLEYLLEPALEKYDFEVIRADRIPRPSVITSDIIRLVQESDLCIIDITNSNPNVFYECGRRHETGRPFIQMIASGKTTDIPFDVAGIRTLEYDISTTAKARSSVKDLQAFIDEIVKGGFGDKSAGYTMASLGEAVDRIERKITKIILEQPTTQSAKSVGGLSIDILTSHPNKAFLRLLQEGNISGAFALLPKVLATSGESEYLTALGVLARTGFEPAADSLADYTNKVISNDSPDGDTLTSIGHSLKDFYLNTGRGQSGVAVLESLFVAANDSGKFDGKILANLANLVGMVAWPSKDHVVGEKYESLAVTLNPSEPAYWFNKALTHETTGDDQKLAAALRGLSKCSPLRQDHLDLLRKHGIDPKT